MSKKQSLLKEIAKHNSRIAELQKQLKQQELQDKVKLADEVISIYKSGKWDVEKLKKLVAKALNEVDDGDGPEITSEVNSVKIRGRDESPKQICREDAPAKNVFQILFSAVHIYLPYADIGSCCIYQILQ